MIKNTFKDRFDIRFVDKDTGLLNISKYDYEELIGFIDQETALLKFQQPEVLIWSNEHNGWWRPNECGYTDFKELAGYYDLDRAIEICKNANRFIVYNKQEINGKIIQPNETIVFE